MAELTAYATVDDIENLARALTDDEKARANNLLPVVSNRLRIEAQKVGKDLDNMIANNEALTDVLRSVTVDITARSLSVDDSSKEGALSQFSESALGYSFSGTFLNAGGGIFIKKSELQALGLARQQYGAIDFYFDNDTDKGATT